MDPVIAPAPPAPAPPAYQAQATYKIEIGIYNGRGGTIAAKAFVHTIELACAAGNVQDQRLAGIVKLALREGAKLWMNTTPAVTATNTWMDLRPTIVRKTILLQAVTR